MFRISPDLCFYDDVRYGRIVCAQKLTLATMRRTGSG